MEAIWQWGIDFIHTVQSIHGPTLDAIFKAITFMGEEGFYLLLLPVILWCVDFGAGTRLAIILFFSVYANEVLKDLFTHPRPYELDPTVKLHVIGGYGLPSGHAQSAVVVWGAIASEFHRKWIWTIAILLMVMIGFSRIYLGVHFPTDVLGGWVVGVIFLTGYLALKPRVEAWLKKTGLTMQLTLAVLLPLFMLLHPTKMTTSVIGVLIGAGVGVALTGQVAPFSATGRMWQRVARLLVGLAILVALYFVLKILFPDQGESFYLPMRIVRYTVIGLWAGFGAPWLFQKLRLASRH